MTSELVGCGNIDFHRLVARWIADAAEALGAAHSIGIIHRDVKPDNIMVRRDGSIVVTDFGLARIRGDLGITQSGEFLGSPAYMSPEQVSGENRDLDHRTDIFSLGVTLYELLTLRRPFEGETTEAVVHRIAAVDPVPPRRIDARIPKDLETITLKALEKECPRRYPDAQELAADLRCFIDGRPIRARPLGPLGKTIRYARRNPPIVMLAAAIGVILLVVGLWIAYSNQKEIRSVDSLRVKTDEAIAARQWRAVADSMAQVAALSPSDAWLVEKAKELLGKTELQLTEYRASSAANAASRSEVVRNRSRYERGRLPENAWRDLFKAEDRLFEQELEKDELYLGAVSAYFIAATYLGDDSAVKKTRERILFERWTDFETNGNRVGMNRMTQSLENESPESPYLQEIRSSGSLTIRTDPPGAQIFIFRFEDERILDPETGLPRLVPVPCEAKAGWRPLRGLARRGVRPGSIVLVVEHVDPGSPAETAGLEAGDLVHTMNGKPIAELFFAGRIEDEESWSYSRIQSVEGRPLTELSTWSEAFCGTEPEPVSLTLERLDGERTSRSGAPRDLWESLGIGAFPWNAEQFLHRAPGEVSGAVRLEALRGEQPFTCKLPLGSACGLRVWTTSCPLLFGPENLAGSSDHGKIEIPDVPSGSYLLLMRHPRYEDLRYPVLVARGEHVTIDVTLNTVGTTPPGFVFIPRCRAIIGGDPMAARFLEENRECWVGPIFVKRDEVSWKEYLTFLNDPRGRALIEREAISGGWTSHWPYPRTADSVAGIKRLGPESPTLYPVLVKIEPDGEVRTRLRPEMEIFLHGVNRVDAQTYVAYLRQIDSNRHRVRLPTEREWEAIARGADGRSYPWGNSFSWQLFHGWHSSPMKTHASLPTSFPVDESPFGVRSLAAGIAVEWCTDEPDESTAVRGGCFQFDDPRHFRAASRVYLGPGQVYNGAMGIRLVLDPGVPGKRR